MCESVRQSVSVCPELLPSLVNELSGLQEYHVVRGKSWMKREPWRFQKPYFCIPQIVFFVTPKKRLFGKESVRSPGYSGPTLLQYVCPSPHFEVLRSLEKIKKYIGFSFITQEFLPHSLEAISHYMSQTSRELVLFRMSICLSVCLSVCLT